MKSINEVFMYHLLEKNVLLRCDIYKKCFHYIIPNYELFAGFLRADSTEKKISFAKKIGNNIYFSLLHTPTASAFCTLLDTETNDITRESSMYIPQDHVVHSVNVYLLGIYLFFNHQLFHERLMDFFVIDGESEYDAILNFISAWKTFALCHDIGYGFERLVTTDRTYKSAEAMHIMQTYAELDKTIKYETGLKAIASLIFTTAVVKKSKMAEINNRKRTLSEQDRERLIKGVTDYLIIAGKDSTGTIVDIHYFFSEFTLLEYINSDFDLELLSPYITPDDVLVVSYDFFGHILEAYPCSKQSSNAKHIQEKETYARRYYCYNMEDSVSQQANRYKVYRIYDEKNFGEIAVKLCEPELSLVVNNCADCRNVVIAVFERLKELFHVDDIGQSYAKWIIKSRKNSKQEALSLSTQRLSKYLINTIEETLDGLSYHTGYEQQYKRIRSIIIRLLRDRATLRGALQSLSSTENQKLEGLNILLQLFQDVCSINTDACPKLFEHSRVLKKCNCIPFQTRKSNNSFFASSFEKQTNYISAYLGNLGLISGNDLSTFLKYSPRFSPYDHGILAAHILAYTSAFEDALKEIGHPIMKSRIVQRNSLHHGEENAFREALGAIAVHNVYVERYYELTGIKYKLSLSNHPLAYFGSFCDCIQLWDRHHSADQSKLIIPEFNPSAEHFNIRIDGKQIIITCESESNKKTGHSQRTNLAQFLDGADHLLIVNIIERNLASLID